MGILSKHLTEPTPEVTAEQLTAVGAPAPVAGILRKALAKDKSERFATIDELADAIRATIGPAELGQARGRAAPARRPSVKVLLIGAGLAAVMALVAALLGGRDNASKASDEVGKARGVADPPAEPARSAAPPTPAPAAAIDAASAQPPAAGAQDAGPSDAV